MPISIVEWTIDVERMVAELGRGRANQLRQQARDIGEEQKRRGLVRRSVKFGRGDSGVVEIDPKQGFSENGELDRPLRPPEELERYMRYSIRPAITDEEADKIIEKLISEAMEADKK
jgi:hypothetical protein